MTLSASWGRSNVVNPVRLLRISTWEQPKAGGMMHAEQNSGNRQSTSLNELASERSCRGKFDATYDMEKIFDNFIALDV